MKVCSVDLDGVLNYYPDCWVEYINLHEGTDFQTKEEALKVLDSDKYASLKHKYRLSSYKANLKPNKANIQFLQALRDDGYSIIIATDRPFQKYPGMYVMTWNWLERNGVPFDSLMSKKDVATVTVDFHIDDEPFFTVCIETFNRGKTIFNTLTSVALQSFRNFNVVIVDNQSTDNTVEEIKRFFLSDIYRQHPFPHLFKLNAQRLDGLKNWNEPLKLAKGKYVALLEGDDEYLSNHLKHAYETITSIPDIGFYSVNNPSEQQSYADTYTIQHASAPSEMVFLRENPMPYMFDTDTFHYCPEVGLALDIMLGGHNVYRSTIDTVIRHPSNHESPLVRYLDYFKIARKYRHTVPTAVYKRALKLNVKRLLQFLMYYPLRYLQLKWKQRHE